MKKYILSILSLLFLNTAYSQVVYDEDFDSFTIGNLGTDPDGIIPGQDGWLTECLYVPASKDNSRFTIAAEQGRGKVLLLSSFDPILQPQQAGMDFIAKKTGLNTLIDNKRIPGENVIKLEIDYYTGVQQTGPFTSISLAYFDGILVSWTHRSDNGAIYVSYHNGVTQKHDVGLANNNGSGSHLLPFNTWVTFIAYLDYTNKKIYFETPYFGTVAVGGFLSQSTSTNLMQDFKPSVIHLRISTKVNDTQQMFNKYDNIKITALNAVPGHILNVNTILSEKFNLYPNPAMDMVNITNSENMFVEQVAIYDFTGKQLSTQIFNKEAEIQLNVENLASGVYLFHIKTKEGTAVKKLIKK